MNYDMIEAFKNLDNVGWGNIFVMFLFLLILVVGLLQSLHYIREFFGIETKQTLKDKERDDKITELNNLIDDQNRQIDELKQSDQKFYNDRVHDREQSFSIQKDLVDNLTKLSDTLTEIKIDILEEKMERKRWNILNMADELRHNSYYVDRERYENVFRDYDDYEEIIKKLGRTNGFIEESIKFIRSQYKESLERQ